MTSLLERYEAMLMLSQAMLAAAQSEDWEQLVSTADARASTEAVLREQDHFAWQNEPARRKAEIIQEILAVDAKIKQLAGARLDALQGMLGSINTEMKLKKAYE